MNGRPKIIFQPFDDFVLVQPNSMKPITPNTTSRPKIEMINRSRRVSENSMVERNLLGRIDCSEEEKINDWLPIREQDACAEGMNDVESVESKKCSRFGQVTITHDEPDASAIGAFSKLFGGGK